MSAMLTSEAIIFAIHSAIKLGGAFQKAYANSLKEKKIVLPLPAFNGTLNFDTVERFFRRGDGQPFVEEVERLKELHEVAEAEGQDGLSETDRKEYEDFYVCFFSVVNNTNHDNTPFVSSEELVTLMRIRQWEQGTVKNITPLQLISGSLVEIGIDYFNMVPGAIRSDSSYAKVLKSFLGAIDRVDFAGGGSLKETIVKDIVPKMFVSVAENLNELGANLTSDENTLEFISTVSEGLTKDIYDRIEAMGTDGKQEDVKQWGQLLFKSLVKNSGTYVFSSPEKVFGTGESQSALIQNVGNSLMGVILDKNDSNLDLKSLFTVDTLDKVVKSSLTVVAQYPSLVSNKKGIKGVIIDIAKTVSSSGIQKPGLVPDLAQLVLTSTAGNLHQLWDTNDDSAEHLLVTTTQQLLLALGTDPATGPWRPRLTNQQILAIAESSFSEVIQNKAWIDDKVNDQSLLGEVLNTTFNALGGISEGQRLNFDTLQNIVQINLRTVASSKLVLNKIKWGSTQQETTILNKALDLVFAFSFQENAHNQGNKVAFLFDLMEYTMDVIVSQHPDERGLILTQLLLNANSGAIVENGLNKDIADKLVKASLGVISANPDLLANDKALQNMIAGVANSFQNSGINQSDLLGEFIRIALLQSSGNLELLMPDSDGNPKQLVVLAFKNILETITTKPETGKWRPKLSGTQILALTESLLGEVVRNPKWVSDKVNQDSLLQEVLNVTFNTLEKHPTGKRINFDTLQEVIEITTRTVAISKLVLTKDIQKETILQKVMDSVFEFAFNEPSSVDKSELLIDVLDYIMGGVISANPNDEGLIIVMSLLQKNLGIVSSTGINEELANHFVVSALNALTEHPELVSDKIGIQNIVVGTASALTASNIKDPDIINEFVRLIIENTAGNLNLIINTSKRSQKNILVIALHQILKTTSKRPSSGKWKPVLSPLQVYQITEIVLEEIIANPLWIENNLIQSLMEIVYKSMEKVPKEEPLHHSTFETLLMKAIEAVDNRMNLAVKLVTTADGNQKIALTYALEGFFEAIFDKSKGEIAAWTLTQTNTLNVIVHHYLIFLTGQSIDIQGMDEAIAKVKKAVIDLNNEVLFNLEDLLESLDQKLIKIDTPN